MGFILLVYIPSSYSIRLVIGINWNTAWGIRYNIVNSRYLLDIQTKTFKLQYQLYGFLILSRYGKIYIFKLLSIFTMRIITLAFIVQLNFDQLNILEKKEYLDLFLNDRCDQTLISGVSIYHEGNYPLSMVHKFFIINHII